MVNKKEIKGKVDFEDRNIKLKRDTYIKLRLLKNKFEFIDFDATVDYLLLCWSKNNG